ncbi:hypothetical protein [Pararhizobium sp.]|uniref:hypothetical protein n=1 Tax=Pararhizobium sp. TaxID=1977563 RepID=UPI00271A1C47|nr:hypothetical protein [Pararhizobium sp.]MDO9415053.1 hypothetical protein [Pararhizobium sp.]
MSQVTQSNCSSDDIDALSGALFSWCAERSIRLRSQEALDAASTAIDLYLAGHQTQDQLLGALAAYDMN